MFGMFVNLFGKSVDLEDRDACFTKVADVLASYADRIAHGRMVGSTDQSSVVAFERTLGGCGLGWLDHGVVTRAFRNLSTGHCDAYTAECAFKEALDILDRVAARDRVPNAFVALRACGL